MLKHALALLAFAGLACATLQTPDQTADERWKDKMAALARDPAPVAKSQRAQLAYNALTLHPSRLTRLGLDPDEVRDEGYADALHAAEGMPGVANIWIWVQTYLSLSSTLDPSRAAHAACSAADGRPDDENLWILCGDLLERSGDVAGAVERWNTALPRCRTRPCQYKLIAEIEQSSPDADAALKGLSPILVQQANLWRQKQEFGTEMEKLRQEQSGHLRQNCLAQCQATVSSCEVNQQMSCTGLAQCNEIQSTCEQSCGPGE